MTSGISPIGDQPHSGGNLVLERTLLVGPSRHSRELPVEKSSFPDTYRRGLWVNMGAGRSQITFPLFRENPRIVSFHPALEFLTTVDELIPEMIKWGVCGFIFACFADCTTRPVMKPPLEAERPGEIGYWGMLDQYRKPKLAYSAVKRLYGKMKRLEGNPEHHAP